MSDSPEFSEDQIVAGEKLALMRWDFVKGVVGLEHLPEAGPVEIAFAGRSNVGKSSLINAVLNRRNLARTSNTPGRTQELNVFKPELAPLLLFDMPGYGFAKAPLSKVEAWTTLVKDYLRGRATLARVFLLIDARHGIKHNDLEIMDMLDEAAVSFQVVLTKADKLNSYKLEDVVLKTRSVIAKRPAAFPVVLATSSQSGVGLSGLRASMAQVLADFSA